jgi:hypothetical protein
MGMKRLMTNLLAAEFHIGNPLRLALRAEKRITNARAKTKTMAAVKMITR